MPKKLSIKLYRSASGTSFDSGSTLEHGEVALGYKADHEKFFIRNSNGDIAVFSSDGKVESLGQAVGVNLSGDTKDRFVYKSDVEYLSGETRMSDALDDVAARALYVTPSIETNFDVKMANIMVDGAEATSPIFTFNINTPVTDVVVSKISNGTLIKVYSGNTQSASGTVEMNNIEETYILEFVPTTIPNIIIQEKINAYVCCTAVSSASTIDLSSSIKLNFIITTDKELRTKINTSKGDYIWFLIPSTIVLDEVTSHNIDMSIDEDAIPLEAGIGSFNCYRTLQQLAEHEWKPRIYLEELKRNGKKIVTLHEAYSEGLRDIMVTRAIERGHKVAGIARI